MNFLRRGRRGRREDELDTAVGPGAPGYKEKFHHGHGRHNQEAIDNNPGNLNRTHQEHDRHNQGVIGNESGDFHRNYHGHGRHNQEGIANESGDLNRKRHRFGRHNQEAIDNDSGNFNRRPPFGQWIKGRWLDILTMAAMGAVGLGVYNADPAPSRSFPIIFSDGEVVYPQFAYPLRTEIIPIWEAALIASLVPIAVILLVQIRVRSFLDVDAAIFGLLYSLITAAVFQVFIKWLIGGLRPHFLYVCAPDMDRVQAQGGQGFMQLMFQRDICTGDRKEINDSLESMPSGHSTAAFAGLIYLYFYLNAKLKVFSNYNPAMWKMLAVYAPVLGACLIAGALTIDEFHNWYDCFAGAVIGTVMAISAYRMSYASVWDFRFNHIPLTRHTPFSYGAGPAGAGGFETAVFTRKAGWGYEEAIGGAPFDSAKHLRGAEAGFNTGIHNHNNHHERYGKDRTGMTDSAINNDRDTRQHHLGRHDDRAMNQNNLGQHDDRAINQNHLGHNEDRGMNQNHFGRHDDRNMNQNRLGHPDGRDMNQHHLGHRDGDIEHNAAIPPEPVDNDTERSRYRMHSRSLERKAVNRNSGGLQSHPI